MKLGTNAVERHALFSSCYQHYESADIFPGRVPTKIFHALLPLAAATCGDH
jgi:hypothetical protein